MRPLGHRLYLAAKAKGDKSMVGKAGSVETRKTEAGRGPDGMVKATLLETQCPNRNVTDRIPRGHIRGFREPGLYSMGRQTSRGPTGRTPTRSRERGRL